MAQGEIELGALAGEVLGELLARLGEQGIVGTVASSGVPRIAMDVGADAVFFDNPELPDTHSEMALPLINDGHVIGILDHDGIYATRTARLPLDR